MRQRCQDFEAVTSNCQGMLSLVVVLFFRWCHFSRDKIMLVKAGMKGRWVGRQIGWGRANMVNHVGKQLEFQSDFGPQGEEINRHVIWIGWVLVEKRVDEHFSPEIKSLWLRQWDAMVMHESCRMRQQAGKASIPFASSSIGSFLRAILHRVAAARQNRKTDEDPRLANT